MVNKSLKKFDREKKKIKIQLTQWFFRVKNWPSTRKLCQFHIRNSLAKRGLMNKTHFVNEKNFFLHLIHSCNRFIYFSDIIRYKKHDGKMHVVNQKQYIHSSFEMIEVGICANLWVLVSLCGFVHQYFYYVSIFSYVSVKKRLICLNRRFYQYLRYCLVWNFPALLDLLIRLLFQNFGQIKVIVMT